MKRFFKKSTALLLIIVVLAVSVITAFAANDPVQGASYSYSKTGDCTVDYGGEIYFSSHWVPTRKFTVNGNTAVCAWAVKTNPPRGSYPNVTKYYVSNSSYRAKAFYWLLINSGATISDSRAKYSGSSTTYAQDLAAATRAAEYETTDTYAFVHAVIDDLQQGRPNPYADSDWNDVVDEFTDLIEYYPSVPSSYVIYYFYPNGDNNQSLMTYDPPGRIQITKRSAHPNWTQENDNFDITGAEFSVYTNPACTDYVTTIVCDQQYDLNEQTSINATGEIVTKVAAMGVSCDLAPGTYFIKETKANKGFRLTDDIFSVTVTSGNTATLLTNITSGTNSYSVSNEVNFGTGKLIKRSASPEITDGNSDFSLEGAVYGIYYDEGCTRQYYQVGQYYSFVTDANGEAQIDDLLPRTYYVKEITAPDGYELDETVYTVVIKENETTVIEAYDIPSYIPEGFIRIHKSSSLPRITEGNGCYSLEGAVYGIYTDSECRDKVDEITTDSNGEGMSSALPVGDYYVKEISASEGYKIDVTVHPESVVDAEITDCRVTETPYTQTIEVLLYKRNASTVVTDEDMSGAEYTVNFYTEYLNSENDVRTASHSRSWILKTDLNNSCKLDDDHLVSGDSLYQDGEGNFVLPLGTVTLQETKAPYGFYLDDTLFIRKITKDSASGVTQYNVPVSQEFEIPDISISGKKTWQDDNNRDGKRPQSITVELYRDNEFYDRTLVTEATDWKYEFTGLKKACVDVSAPDHIHYYEYDVREVSVEYYDDSSSGISADPEDENHYICDFTNHHTIERTSVSGTKSWDDYNNAFGYRPASIKVVLYRNGSRLYEQTVTQSSNWSYTFTNLYKYYDGGKEYRYSVTEEAIPGYSLEIDGYNMKNSLKKGSVTLNKANESGAPLKDVSFKLYTVDGKAVSSTTDGQTYIFASLTNNDEEAIYTTNSNGKIIINGLPYGKYYFVESQTLLGFIPYGKQIPFEISFSNEAALNVSVDVENAKYVMPETGGVGSDAFYIASITLAGLAVVLFCCFIIKKSTMKGIYHND